MRRGVGGLQTVSLFLVHLSYPLTCLISSHDLGIHRQDTPKQIYLFLPFVMHAWCISALHGTFGKPTMKDGYGAGNLNASSTPIAEYGQVPGSFEASPALVY